MVTELTRGPIQTTSLLVDPDRRLVKPTGTADPDLSDVIDDLAELDHIISDLSQFSAHDDSDEPPIDCDVLSREWAHSNFRRAVAVLRASQQRTLDLVERATRWADANHLRSLLNQARRQYLSTKSAARAGYRQRGTLLCAYDWQSPAYESSIPTGFNRLSHGIAEHCLDYKRDGHLDALAYEEQFVTEYACHLGPVRPTGYLANSGMGAFTTVIHWLADELHLAAPALAVRPMYFENLHLARAFFPDLVQHEPESSDDLVQTLRTLNPSVVLCDAVSNCGKVQSHDVGAILQWAARESSSDVAVVIDTTCLPCMLLPAGMLAHLPEHVTVILVESLAKHHQFGMDIVTGGIALIHARKALHENFRKTRARLGANISDASVGSLPKPSRSKLLRRMQRHSRNTRILASQLEESAGAPDGVIESISWLRDGTEIASWYAGSCFSIELCEPFRSIEKYRQFEQTVLELARQRNLPVALGTSFGFDVSRLYVTAPATAFEQPFLRVSVGTETARDIEALAEILEMASIELGRAWNISQRSSRKAEQAPTRPASVRPLPGVFPEKPGIAASVYAGPDALKRYLSPANYAPAPLVELPADLNPFRADGVRLFAKMMPLVPLMNIKSIPAFSMLSKAAERGELEGVKRIIESSSSNTVLSLSVMARLFGIDSTYAIVDHSIAPSLLRMLRLFGIEVYMHPGPGHELFGKLPPRSERAADCGRQPGWLNPGQYSNPDNPEGFAQWLGPELWAQTRGRLGVLSCALGTCGTMVGVSRALRERDSSIEIVACCPKPGDAVPGPREKSQLADVSFPWQDVANARLELSAEESFASSVRLLRKGILGGPSSGMNYAGALRYLEQEKDAGRLAPRVESRGELWCVFLCCDSPLPHVDEYYEALGEEHFPVVHPIPKVNGPVDELDAN
ncbi:MAG TPA: pyridoxal-phosphate dependent enzyme [Candidatus Obscuribacterales bacterium]